MYSVYAKRGNDNVCIYNDIYTTPETIALEPKLELEESCAGSFKIKLAPTNNGYNFIERLNTEIIIYKENVEIWSGRVLTEKTDFWKNRVIECEGELAYLNDTLQPQAEYHDITPENLLRRFIEIHNSMATSDKQFTVGIVTVTDPNDSLYRYSNYESTLETINDKLVSRLGGYLSIRKVNGVRYLDWLAERPNTSTQSIEFGSNLLDFTKSFDSTDFCTVILPLGASQEENEIEALQSYLTIESVNDGSPYLVNQESYEEFGWICAVEHWDDVTQPSTLKSKAQQYLSEIQFDNMVLEVNAIDLHYTDREIESIKISNRIRVISRVHGLDRYFPVTKMSIPLDNPSSTAFTLGDSIKQSLSSRTNSGDQYVKELVENMPTESAILNRARENADQIVRSFTNGYITITQEDNGSEELYISDYKGTSGEDIIENSSRYWRWNLNGLAYYDENSSSRGSSDYVDPTDGLKLALTMDGHIVANFIDVGVLTANIVKAGILRGLNNSDNYWNMETGELHLATTAGYGNTTLSAAFQVNADAITSEVARATNAEGELNSIYSGRYKPTPSNSPASSWNTTSLKDKHINDQFVNTDTGDTYLWKKAKGGVILTFNPQCETEGTSWDYLRVYYWDGSSYRYTINYGGRSSNNLKNLKLFVPSNSFYIYWRSDSINANYWGFKVDICEAGAYEGNVNTLYPYSTSSLPISVTNTISGTSTMPETSHPYNLNEQKLWQWNTQISLPSGDYQWVRQSDFSVVYSRIQQTADAITSEVTRATSAEGTLSSQIQQTANQISLKVSKGDVSSQLSIEQGQITLSSGRLVITSGNFQLDSSGYLTCYGANIRGTFKGGSDSNYYVEINGSRISGSRGGHIDFNNWANGSENNLQLYSNTVNFSVNNIGVTRNQGDGTIYGGVTTSGDGWEFIHGICTSKGSSFPGGMSGTLTTYDGNHWVFENGLLKYTYW